jgi:hypothetical protein
MHSALHVAIAHESARVRVERREHSRGGRPFTAIRARVARARDLAPGAFPTRAAPGV